jgi:hypothetical protein
MIYDAGPRSDETNAVKRSSHPRAFDEFPSGPGQLKIKAFLSGN